MDEPLLGHSQRRSFGFQRNLFKIAEDFPFHDTVVDVPVMPVPMSPSQFKERLVYGALESPTSYYLPRLFGSNEQGETEDFLAEGQRRRGYNFHPVEERQWKSYAKEAEANKQSVPTEDSYLDWRIECLRGDDELSLSSLSSEEELDKDEEAGVGTGSGCGDWPRSVPKRRFLRKSRTAPALNVRFSKKDIKIKRPKLETASGVVVQASFGLLIYLAIGVAIYVWRRDDFSVKSTFPIIDALYFCIVTMCTIGYGDITPVTPAAKLFSCIFVLVGFGFIDILLSGMVAYVLERQEHLLLSAVEGSHHETAKNYVVNTQKGRMRIRMKVALALGVVLFCLTLGTVVMHWIEELGWLDSFYLSCMSVTTVGYGDHAFKTMKGRLFAAGWLLVSTLAVARSFLFLAEARIDRRNRLIAKWVLHREMTVGDLLAADMDNNGFVTKSEYVIYKLKEMGKIGEKDILDVCRQFNILDRDNSGRITISCLMNVDTPVH